MMRKPTTKELIALLPDVLSQLKPDVWTRINEGCLLVVEGLDGLQSIADPKAIPWRAYTMDATADIDLRYTMGTIRDRGHLPVLVKGRDGDQFTGARARERGDGATQ